MGNRSSYAYVYWGVAFALVTAGKNPAAQEISAPPPFVGECQAQLREPLGMSLPHYGQLVTGKRAPSEAADHRALRDYREYQDRLRRCVGRGRLKAADPLIYSLLNTTWDYQQRQYTMTPNEHRIFSNVLTLGSAALVYVPLLAAAVQGVAAGVGLAYDPEKYAQVKAGAEAVLLQRLRSELAAPADTRRTPKQIYAALMNEVKSGQLYGVPGGQVDPNGLQLLEDVFKQLQAEYDGGDNKTALAALGKKRLPVPSSSGRKEAYRATVESSRALREQVLRDAKITDQYKKLVKDQATALNDRTAYNLEDRYMRGMTGEQREQLLARFDSATEAQRMADPTLSWLVGASDKTRASLKGRASVAKQAAEISQVARHHAAAYDGAYRFAVTFKIGGPDLHKALAASTIAASSVAAACDILATGGVATPLVTLQMLGVLGNLVGGLGGLFGGQGDDGLAHALAELQRSIMEALKELSLQMDRGFYLASLQSEEQRELAELLLLVATKDLRDARDGCVALDQVLSANPFSHDGQVVDMLRRDANHERLYRCLTPLVSARDFSVTGAGAPTLMSLRYTTALDSAIEPNSSAARQWRAFTQNYVDTYHPALLRLFDHTLTESNGKIDKTQYRERSHYEFVAGGGRDIEELRARLARSVPKNSAKSDLGTVMAPYDFRDRSRTLRTALTTAIDGGIAPTYLYPMLGIGPFLRLTTADFRPVSSDLNDTARSALTVERDSMALALASSYWPTAMTLSAQERLKAGDVLLPAIDALLKKGECDAAATFDPQDSNTIRAQKILRIDACNVVRVFPELRSNLLHWRMREAADTTAAAAKRSHGRLGWAYAAARDMDDAALSTLIGNISTVWLTDDSGISDIVIKRRHSRLAGKCDGITKTSEVAAKICETGTCRAPLRRGDLLPGTNETVKDEVALREQLQVCVMSELPAAQDFASGRLVQTGGHGVAERLETMFAERVIGASVVSNAPEPMKGIARIAIQP